MIKPGMIVELIRHEESEEGTIGILKINKVVFCFTLEPSDELNVSNISSIPEQQYICAPYSSAKYPRAYQVLNVPGRSKILFHSGNTKEATRGCILLGEKLGKLKVGAAGQEKRAILNSGKTMDNFLRIMNEGNFHLTIKTDY